MLVAGLSSPAAAQAPRGYELISPPDKNNASLIGGMVIDADHVDVVSAGSIFDSDPFYVGVGKYVAARSATDGWDLSFSSIARNSFLVDYLSAGDRIYESGTPVLAGEQNDAATDVYRWTDGQLALLSTGELGGQGPFEATYAASSAGGGHVLFTTAEQLEPEDHSRTMGGMLYERVGDETRAVGLTSDEQPLGDGGAVLAGDGPSALTVSLEGGTSYPISADGRRIFFESPDPSLLGDTQLYVREDGEQTTQVSAPQRSTPNSGSRPVRFEGAAKDGSLVFFRTQTQLTDDDVDELMDLYRYDVSDGTLRRVSGNQQGAESGSCPADGEGGPHGVCGVAAVSEDGRRAYFLSTGVLAADATAGHMNLYLYDGLSDSTRTVVSVPNIGGVDFDNPLLGLTQSGLDGNLGTAEATPDGSVLVFPANSRLTAFDNASPGCPVDELNPLGRCTEVYRYDAIADDLVCVSCNLFGAPPLGSAGLPAGRFAPQPVRRFSTADGSLIAFETVDALVPGDDNGEADVYEWRNGHVSLVSSGQSPRRAILVGIGPDGDDIVFLTGASLLPEDTDTLTDLDDARVGGGFPGPPGPAPRCLEGSCQGTPAGLSPLAAPVNTAEVEGNVRAAPVARLRQLRVSLAEPGRTRRLAIRFSVNVVGTVRVAAWAQIGSRARVVARRVKRISAPGPVRLSLPLSTAARRELLRDRRLVLTVSARLARASRIARERLIVRLGAGR